MLNCIFLLALFITQPLGAITTLIVEHSTDNEPGSYGEPGDLRYCINTMNESLQTTPDDFSIIFSTPMTIQLNGILPIINTSTYPVTISIGNSSHPVIIDGQNTYPGFFIPYGNVTIQNITFQNMVAKGGDGGNGISGGGGGMGAGGALYIPAYFGSVSNPQITLINVAMNNCSAVGGNGGNCLSTKTGYEGGGGGGGFSGNGGSITTTDSTGGGGGGGFGGNGGDATTNSNDPNGGGGGGGGGIGSRANLSAGTTFENLGNGGSDTTNGEDGNCYGLNSSSGNGGGGLLGGIRGGGGAGGNSTGSESGGGGGGGISGQNGYHSQGVVPPGGEVTPSGGLGGDGGGGGGGSVVAINTNNGFDGRANNGGYGGGGGGGAGLGGSSGIGSGSGQYSVAGGSGGTGGGGGGGGVGDNQTPSNGGNSSGGGGGGSGPTNGGSITPGGTDIGHLGGGTGGSGATDISPTAGGGGGGGGSGLGGAIFIDSTVSLNIQARSDNPTVFNTTNCTVQQGNGGTGWDNSDSNGTSGSSLGNSIFLRSGSSLVLTASGLNDILTLGSDVSFTDDTSFGEGNTNILVQGAGTVIYTGTSDYEGTIIINNANFQVQGLIDNANIQICRNTSINERRGMLSGTGTLTGFVYVQSGMIAPNAGSTLTLGSLQLNSAIPNSTLGSLVAISIDANGSSLVAINGDAQLAGKLELNIEPDALVGTYTILTSPHITGTFDDMVIFTHQTPNYAVSYLPIENPTYVLFDFLGYSSLEPVSNLQGSQKKNNFGFEYELYNQLTWTASSSNNVAGYFIYRDAQKIATVDTSTLSYQDHNRQQGTSYTYAITTFDSEDNESSPATVTIS